MPITSPALFAFLQRAQVCRVRRVRMDLRPGGPRHFADVNVAAAVDGEAMQRQKPAGLGVGWRLAKTSEQYAGVIDNADQCAAGFLATRARDSWSSVEERRCTRSMAPRWAFAWTRNDWEEVVNSSAFLWKGAIMTGDSAQHLAIMQARNKAFRWPKGTSSTHRRRGSITIPTRSPAAATGRGINE
jgi:hypothetical protein